MDGVTDNRGGASQEKTRKQHTVSRTILRRFVEETSGLLESFDLIHGGWNARSPGAVGVIRDFLAHDPSSAEERWQEIEDRVPLVYAAIESRTLLNDDWLVSLAKDVVALHVVRSWTRLDVHLAVLSRSKDDLIPLLLQDPAWLAARFFERTGIHLAGSEALLQQARREADMYAKVEFTESFKQWRIMLNLEEARIFLRPAGVEVIEAAPDAGRFMISDNPAAQLKAGYQGLGPLTGVSWQETDMVVLPLSPTITLGVTMKGVSRWVMASEGGVHMLNCIQLSNAKQRVFYRPSESRRNLALRAIEARRHRPETLGPTLIDLKL